MGKIVQPTGDISTVRLAELLEVEANLSPGQGAVVLRALLSIIARHVAAGFRVRLTNFGSFFPRTRHVSRGNLPGRELAEPIDVRRATFRASGMFEAAVRDGAPVLQIVKRPKGSLTGTQV